MAKVEFLADKNRVSIITNSRSSSGKFSVTTGMSEDIHFEETEYKFIMKRESLL